MLQTQSGQKSLPYSQRKATIHSLEYILPPTSGSEGIQNGFRFSMSILIQPSCSVFSDKWISIMAAFTLCYREAIEVIQNIIHKVVQFVYSIVCGLTIIVAIALAIYFSLRLLEWAYGRLNRYLVQSKRYQFYKKWLENLDTQRAREEQRPQFIIPSRLEQEYQG